MNDTVISSAFNSFEALCVRNDELLASAEAPDQSLSSISREQIANFMTAAAATGAVISNPRDRRKAQTIINFWAAELITRSTGQDEWSAPQLSSVDARRSGDRCLEIGDGAGSHRFRPGAQPIAGPDRRQCAAMAGKRRRCRLAAERRCIARGGGIYRRR